jgi:hypothetical protein
LNNIQIYIVSLLIRYFTFKNYKDYYPQIKNITLDKLKKSRKRIIQIENTIQENQNLKLTGNIISFSDEIDKLDEK